MDQTESNSTYSHIRDLPVEESSGLNPEGPTVLRPDNFTMDKSYSTSDAICDLVTAENPIDEAKDDLIVIEKNKQQDESLEVATEQFIRILKAEGRHMSSQVQQHFTVIGNTLKPGESREMATDQFLNLIKEENGALDAITSFKIIRTNQLPGESLKDVTRQFLRILKAEGNENTEEVQKHFLIIGNSLKPGESREMATDSFLALVDEEEQAQDAINSFQLIKDSLKPDESITEASRQFIRLLRAAGVKNSKDHQKFFHMAGNKEKSTGEGPEEKNEFIRMMEGENGSADAARSFRSINASRRPDESLINAISQFSRLLDAEGHGNALFVQDHFSLIGESLKPEESRKDAIEIFISLMENSADTADAVENYCYIDSLCKSGKDRQILAGRFIEMLGESKNPMDSAKLKEELKIYAEKKLS